MNLKKIIKRIIPRIVFRKVHEYQLSKFLSDKNTVEEIFTAIYTEKIWTQDEESAFSSGSGSLSADTILYIDFLNQFIKKNGIRSILEIGCGDFRIMSSVLNKQDSNLEYIGGDVVLPLIRYNNKSYSTENINFIKLNAIEDKLPKADLCIIRQVFQHLSNEQVKTILLKLKIYKYVLITEHLPLIPQSRNINKRTGSDIRLFKKSGVYLNYPPFNQNSTVALEYRSDMEVYGSVMPAIMRTSLIVFN